MNEIKLYEELTAIETFDGIVYSTAKPNEIDRIVETGKFLQVGEERIAVHQIKRYGIRKIDTIESFILSKPKEIQDILKTRQKQKEEKIGRGFDNIQEIQNFLKEKGFEI